MDRRKRRNATALRPKAKKVSVECPASLDGPTEDKDLELPFVIMEDVPCQSAGEVTGSVGEVTGSEGEVTGSDQETDQLAEAEDKTNVLSHVKGSEVKKSAGLYRPPTHDELQGLKETQDLFGSNLMRLQITELLSEVRPAKRVTDSLDEFLHSLKKALVSLPKSEQINLCDGLTTLRRKIQYPLNLDLTKVKGKFQFLPPSGVKVIGGYLLGTLTKPDLAVDITLHMPVECLQAKDHLNYRYFHKRALFLSIVAGHLRKTKKRLGIRSIQFSMTNPLLPVLTITAEGKSLSKYSIHLYTSVLGSSLFKHSKFYPDRNNVRRCYLLQNSNSEMEHPPSSSEFSDPPTPHYNTALLVELGARERHLHELYSVLQDSPNLVDAVILCKVWAKQRSLDKGLGCFSGFQFAMLVAALHAQRKVNKLMSSYQVFRIVVQFIASSDWTRSGLTSLTGSSTPLLDMFHAVFDVVFLDSSGLINIFADVSKETYNWLKHEASLALHFLNDLSVRGFQALFVTSLPPLLTFDTLFHVSTSIILSAEVISDQKEREAILLDSAAWPLPLVINHILPILVRGLDNRVKLVTVLPSPPAKWEISEAPPTTVNDHVTIALLLDTDHAFSVINMGPPSDSQEAGEFRKFWGQRSELRRFQDGSINEAVMWEGLGSSVNPKRTACHQIIQHLLERHAGLPKDCVSCTVNNLDSLLSLHSYSNTKGDGGGGGGGDGVSTGEELALGVIHAFTELSRCLRQLKDIPLSVTSLQGASSAFRHTEVFPYSGKLSSKYLKRSHDLSQSDCCYPSCDIATPTYIPVHEVVCLMESSGKWPDDIEAIGKIKTSFYLYISKALKGQGLVSSPTNDYLDIMKEGHVFRLRIHYHRETHLLKDAITMTTESNEAMLKQRLSWVQTHLVSLPILTSSLNGVHAAYPAFSCGARLCKRWVAAQLMSNHIVDEAVELMVAYLFVSPAPYTPPGSPLTTVLRFLSLLTNFDWSAEPLIVNFNNELTCSDVSEIVSKFIANRSSLPPLVIVTPTDRDHAPFSTPSRPVFSRLKLLAKESLDVLKGQLENPLKDGDFKQCFRPPLLDYHVLIHLHKRHLPRYEQSVDAIATGTTLHYRSKTTQLPVVDFDPVQNYLQELEMAFSEFALFFYDKYGCSYVAVVWKPSAFTPRPFRVMQAHCRVDSDLTGSMVPDSEAIVADFRVLGQGLVKDVQTMALSPCGN